MRQLRTRTNEQQHDMPSVSIIVNTKECGCKVSIVINGTAHVCLHNTLQLLKYFPVVPTLSDADGAAKVFNHLLCQECVRLRQMIPAGLVVSVPFHGSMPTETYIAQLVWYMATINYVCAVDLQRIASEDAAKAPAPTPTPAACQCKCDAHDKPPQPEAAATTTVDAEGLVLTAEQRDAMLNGEKAYTDMLKQTCSLLTRQFAQAGRTHLEWLGEFLVQQTINRTLEDHLQQIREKVDALHMRGPTIAKRQ